VRPAAHPPSFASPKEGGPRKGDPQSASPVRPVGRTGATCDARSWGVPQNSLRSSNSAQTAAAIQMTKRVCPSAHTPTPAPALPGAARRGGERVPHGCCCAVAPGVGDARGARCRRTAQPPWRAERSEGPQAERSNGPYGARSHPLLTVPRSAGPGVSACRRTRASLSGSPKLFDRSCLAEAAQGVLRRHPRTEHRRLPHSPTGRVGTRAAGSPFFWVLFFGEAKNKYLGRRAETRPPPSAKASRQNRAHKQSQEITAPQSHPRRPGARCPCSRARAIRSCARWSRRQPSPQCPCHPCP